jgi:precorrin-6B methylase 2
MKERTNDPYFSTPKEVVLKKLELLNLKDGDVVVDLGCGDARNLIQACAIADVKCIGYEVDPDAIEDARINIENSGFSDRIEIKTADFYKADISEVDAVILFLTRNALGEISLKLENELKKGAKIVTHQFDLPAWSAEKTIEILQKNSALEQIYLYQK